MKLGSVTFDNPLFNAEFSDTPVIVSKEATVDGGAVIWTQENQQGQNIDLVGYENSGWLKYSTLKQIKSMAAISGAEYTLEKSDGTTVQVRFRHEDTPVIDVAPIVERAVYDDTDYFYGTIKLAEVK